MSDVLLILSDARFPSFHFPPSLYKYVTEVKNIPIVLILNKIDLIPADLVEVSAAALFLNLISFPFGSLVIISWWRL